MNGAAYTRGEATDKTPAPDAGKVRPPDKRQRRRDLRAAVILPRPSLSPWRHTDPEIAEVIVTTIAEAPRAPKRPNMDPSWHYDDEAAREHRERE